MNRKRQEDTPFYEQYLWDTPPPSRMEENLVSAAQHACMEWKSTQGKTVLASFYPYTGLKSTIRIQGPLIKIRISDILQDAPRPILFALIQILLARAYRKKPNRECLQQYNEYIHQSHVETKHTQVRKQKSRKVLPGPVGKYYNLNPVFTRINRTYFGNQLEKPVLSWSPKRSWRTLGYHDSHLNLVIISRALDSHTVPEFMVDYIMYHELLHILVPVEYREGKRIVHSRDFRIKERDFKEYPRVVEWLGKKRK